MSYVDLNPVRAAMADTPEASDHTAIQARISRDTETPTTIIKFQGKRVPF